MKNLKVSIGISICIALATAGVFLFKKGAPPPLPTETPVLIIGEASAGEKSQVPIMEAVESMGAEKSKSNLAESVEKEITRLEKRKSDLDLRLSQLGFPKVVTNPRITESEKSEINELLRAKSKVRMKIFDLQIQLIEMKEGNPS